MTGAEKYLRSLVDQNEYITNMIRRKEELIERSKTIKTVDTSVERVQTSHNTDRICDITTEIAALEQEIEEEDAKLWKSMYEFKQLMNNVHDIAYIRVLNQIYFLFHTPERAAQELKRSRSWIYTKHEEAVKAFEQGNEEFLNRWVIERMNNSEQIDDYENENNPIKAFIDDCGIEMIENEPTSDVYRRYQVFCADCGMQPMSKGVFSKQINKRLGFETSVTRVGDKLIRIFRKV